MRSRSLAHPALVLIAFTSLARGQSEPINGWNHPWMAYGHDFGSNAWGHDGVITSGWTYQTHPTTQGFTDTRRVGSSVYSGVPALQITADIAGYIPSKMSGEVELSALNHPPLMGMRRVRGAPLNLDGVTARMRVWLPPGSAGPPNAPNGIELFFKTRASDTSWPSLRSGWQNIPGDGCLEIAAAVRNGSTGTAIFSCAGDPLGAGAGPAAEAGFDARSVALFGDRCEAGHKHDTAGIRLS